MMSQRKETKYTIEDIYALPEGTRAELLDGELYMMAPPSTTHQRVVKRISRVIDQYIDEHGGDCESFISPFAVFLELPTDNQAYVEPDVSVVCNPGKVDDKGCHGAPDWIIEVVSPGSRKLDYTKKVSKYGEAGVREYWLVDLERERTTIYRFEEDAAPSIHPFTEELKVQIYDNLWITIQDLL